MGFNYSNIQTHQTGGKKMTRKVIIKNGKGYKSLCMHKHGKKCHSKKARLSGSEIEMIKIGKFIPGLFNGLNISKKTQKRR